MQSSVVSKKFLELSGLAPEDFEVIESDMFFSNPEQICFIKLKKPLTGYKATMNVAYKSVQWLEDWRKKYFTSSHVGCQDMLEDLLVITELLIPIDAKVFVSSEFKVTFKLRADSAKVMYQEIPDVPWRWGPRSTFSIHGLIAHKLSFSDDNFYEIGKITYPDSFDSAFKQDCGHGVHFFLQKSQAEQYIKNFM